MKSILTLILCFTIITVVKAQSQEGSIQGLVTDQQKPIETATVLLLRSKDSAVVKTTFTDNTGKFSLQEIKEDDYLISIQFVGFANYYSDVFHLSKSQFYQLKSIVLSPLNKQINNVTVTSKKPFIEQKLDKTVVNVDASPTNADLTALDVLEKSPGVSVDKDGNVSLKGKQGVLILIDGKPTYLSGQDLANMLKNMTSSNLDQIEIMTNPPAKYDASGNSGIINIKTKKSKQFGYNGSISSTWSQGRYPKVSESFNFNYRKNKLNLFTTLGYNYRKNWQDLDIQRKFIEHSTKEVYFTCAIIYIETFICFRIITHTTTKGNTSI